MTTLQPCSALEFGYGNEMGARPAWQLLKSGPYVNTLGALTGNQAQQQVKMELSEFYWSGWWTEHAAGGRCFDRGMPRRVPRTDRDQAE